jgi:hypothetical protein
MFLGGSSPQFRRHGLLLRQALYERVEIHQEPDADDGEAHGDSVHVIQALAAELDHQHFFIWLTWTLIEEAWMRFC